MKKTLSSVLPREYYVDLLDGFIENPLVGINVTDGEGRILFLNRAHQKITGHSPKLYEGCTVFDLLNKGLISTSATARVIATGEPVLVDQASSHSEKHFQVYAIPYKDNKGEIRFVINYLIDTTELVDLQNRVSDKGDEGSRYNLLKRFMSNNYGLVYQSENMESVIEAATRIAKLDVAVLITGQPGTGKGMMAEFIHSQSDSHNGPFVKLNCASIPDQLLEVELFGEEEKGAIENARGGTLLLDEVGEMSTNIQAKLLVALQSKKIRRVGGTEDIDVDFRLITSSYDDLNDLIIKKKFREDLYYRISAVEIELPSLDDRQEDIPLLINHFLDGFNIKYDSNRSISHDAIKYLSKCSYAGNIRELKGLVERMLFMEATEEIGLEEVLNYTERLRIGLPRTEEGSNSSPIDTYSMDGKSLKSIMADYEKEVLKQYLMRFGSGSQVAKILKTDQSTISRKLNKYDLN